MILPFGLAINTSWHLFLHTDISNAMPFWWVILLKWQGYLHQSVDCYIFFFCFGLYSKLEALFAFWLMICCYITISYGICCLQNMEALIQWGISFLGAESANCNNRSFLWRRCPQMPKLNRFLNILLIWQNLNLHKVYLLTGRGVFYLCLQCTCYFFFILSNLHYILDIVDQWDFL